MPNHRLTATGKEKAIDKQVGTAGQKIKTDLLNHYCGSGYAGESSGTKKGRLCRGKLSGDPNDNNLLSLSKTKLTMSGLSESKKRDFVSQLITILGQNAPLLTAKGYDPATKITELQTELTAADEAEGRQTEAKAAAKAATSLAQETLSTAYDDGSATVELIVGLLGKKDPLVEEIKKLRKNGSTRNAPEMPQ